MKHFKGTIRWTPAHPKKRNSTDEAAASMNIHSFFKAKLHRPGLRFMTSGNKTHKTAPRESGRVSLVVRVAFILIALIMFLAM